jgi:hypothetical protein
LYGKPFLFYCETVVDIFAEMARFPLRSLRKVDISRKERKAGI